MISRFIVSSYDSLKRGFLGILYPLTQFPANLFNLGIIFSLLLLSTSRNGTKYSPAVIFLPFSVE